MQTWIDAAHASGEMPPIIVIAASALRNGESRRGSLRRGVRPLIFGLALRESRAFGKEREQNAIDWSVADAVPLLVLLLRCTAAGHSPPRRTTGENVPACRRRHVVEPGIRENVMSIIRHSPFPSKATSEGRSKNSPNSASWWQRISVRATPPRLRNCDRMRWPSLCVPFPRRSSATALRHCRSSSIPVLCQSWSMLVRFRL